MKPSLIVDDKSIPKNGRHNEKWKTEKSTIEHQPQLQQPQLHCSSSSFFERKRKLVNLNSKLPSIANTYLTLNGSK